MFRAGQVLILVTALAIIAAFLLLSRRTSDTSSSPSSSLLSRALTTAAPQLTSQPRAEELSRRPAEPLPQRDTPGPTKGGEQRHEDEQPEEPVIADVPDFPDGIEKRGMSVDEVFTSDRKNRHLSTLSGVHDIMRNMTFDINAGKSNPAFSNCVPGVGAKEPPAICTPQNPCLRPLNFDRSAWRNRIEQPSFRVTCRQDVMFPRTTEWRRYNDGIARVIKVPNTTAPEASRRYYCAYVPPALSHAAAQRLQRNETRHWLKSNRPVPLIIFLHGSASNATIGYMTQLRGWADLLRVAFVSAQSMNRHWPASGFLGPNEDGTKWDDVFRDEKRNDDVKFLDVLIDKLVATGKINPRRIFLTGTSNGLMFAAFYGMIRSGSTDGGALGQVAGHTPAGNKIAAVAGFSGSDPLKGFGWNEKCWVRPVPKSRLPVLVISRVCDVIRCEWVREWMKTLREDVGSVDAQWLLLKSGDSSKATHSCAAKAAQCSSVKDLIGHGMWPYKRVHNILRFFQKHS